MKRTCWCVFTWVGTVQSFDNDEKPDKSKSAEICTDTRLTAGCDIGRRGPLGVDNNKKCVVFIAKCMSVWSQISPGFLSGSSVE